MKALIILAIVLAFASCSIYPLNIDNSCSVFSCQQSIWSYNNTNYNYTCPQSGQLKAKFIVDQGRYIFNFTSDNTFSPSTNITMYLTEVTNATSTNGIQYYQTLHKGHYFNILNCTIPSSRNISSLCNTNELVGGKYYNGIFQDSCAFGLNRPRMASSQQETPLEFQTQF